MKRILLIEDDQSFGYILSEYLSMHDYIIDWAKSGEEGYDLLKKFDYVIAILDIMLPGENGYQVAEKISLNQPQLPFIFLSAMSLKINKLKGYKLGAYDYITKPVDEEILVAKIEALTRIAYPSQIQKKNYQIGKYSFEPAKNLLCIDDLSIRLTSRESKLLHLFCDHKNELLSREKALKQIWHNTDEFSRKSMDVFISHLRKHLSKDSAISINNIHGKGFVLNVKN